MHAMASAAFDAVDLLAFRLIDRGGEPRFDDLQRERGGRRPEAQAQHVGVVPGAGAARGLPVGAVAWPISIKG